MINRTFRVEVQHNALSRRVLHFYLMPDLTLVLDEDKDETRASTRHKWRYTRLWARQGNKSNYKEVPQEIIDAALKHAREQIVYTQVRP